jgi:hypothetical protein
MKFMGDFVLLDNSKAVWRSLLGGTVILNIGVMIPQTMFWREEEFPTIAAMNPAKNLPHSLFGQSPVPLAGFEMNTIWKVLLVGAAKIVATGFRRGFKFPFFAAGAAFGNVLLGIFPKLYIQLAT